WGDQMHGSAYLDELDRILVTALQTSPRASWQQVGRVLDVSASTAARRWDRLAEAGLAWFSGHPTRPPNSSFIRALIEIDCATTRLLPIGTTLAADPHVLTVNHVTGSHDLLVTAVFSDQISLGRYIRFRIGRLAGVRSVHPHLVTALHTEGSRWRLDRLTAAHRVALLTDTRPAPPARSPDTHADTHGPDAVDMALIAALSTNPRRPAAELARDIQVSTTSVRRRLARLDAARLMACRCEVARHVSGWPTAVNFWGAVPPEHAPRISGRIAQLRETRLCASLSGPDNLMFSAWFRSLHDLQPFEAFLAKQLPELAVTARNLVLWHMKLGTNTLDPEGRRIDEVPFSLWSPGEAVAAENTVLEPGSAQDARAVGVAAGDARGIESFE
ncbi:Lrp/AsnC family transcriptional regulator, partial [Actinophytocola sp.]|uniref:Lrp/AsnC family transcriptional regulator n=1 Tax=Actinophytocola sp. TaxID=1872138 RepID=UPI00389A4D90